MGREVKSAPVLGPFVKGSISSIPARIGNDKPEHNADVGGGKNPPAQKAPGPGLWGRPRVSFAGVKVIEESTGDSSSQASTHFSDVTPMSVSGDSDSHAFGQAAVVATREEDSEEDLFSSSSDEIAADV